MMDYKMHKIENIAEATSIPTETKTNTEKTDANERSTVQLLLKNYFYTWTVEKFSKCLKFCNPKFYSPEFIFENTLWRLQLHVKEKDDVMKISIRLVKKEKVNSDLYIKYKVTLFNAEGKILSHNAIESSFQGNTSVSNQVFLFLDDSGTLALTNDKLIVHCEFLVLSPNVCDDGRSRFHPASNVSDTKSKLASKNVQYPKPCVGSSMSFPQFVTRRLNERNDFQCWKKQQLWILFPLMILTLFFITIQTASIAYDKKHNKSCDERFPIQNNEINELVIDSTLKLTLLAEALNLTNVKVKSLEILTSYLRLYNNSNQVIPLIKRVNSTISEILTSKISATNFSHLKPSALNSNNDIPKTVDNIN